jgi:hypothetical protein
VTCDSFVSDIYSLKDLMTLEITCEHNLLQEALANYEKIMI